MLQQTTVAAVAPRFAEFLARFPTVAALAAADEQTVLRAWEGLGYYRRARNLHAAARRVVAEHDGVVPTNPDILRQLPGLGRYAANAVACFAGDVRVPILEANTVRVWCRQGAVPGDPARQPANGMLWAAATAILPPRGSAAELNQALLDLGAMVCVATAPRCGECPVSFSCRAHAAGLTEDFPQTARRPKATPRREAAAILWQHGKVLVRQRPDGGRWSAMWEFPVLELLPGADPAVAAAALAPGVALRRVGVVRYTVVAEKVELHAFAGHAPDDATMPPGVWRTPAELAELPFATPQRRLVAGLGIGPRTA